MGGQEGSEEVAVCTQDLNAKKAAWESLQAREVRSRGGVNNLVV